MILRTFSTLVGIALLLAQVVQAANEAGQWKAGLAAVDITPSEGVMLLGYPDRKGPSQGVAAPIFAKALALEDSVGHRAVILTTDMVGVQRPIIADPVAQAVMAKTGLARSAILLNASHSHTSPVVTLHPLTRYNVSYGAMTEEEAQRTVRYSRTFNDKLVSAMLQAVDRLAPAELAWGVGHVKFPYSRRLPNKNGLVVMAANPHGSVDRTVPVLRISAPGGKLRGVLFGAACHAVAAGGINQVCGDYPGFAQAYIEREHPGMQAMFLAGCGADANPHPLGTLDLAKSHGGELGSEVCRVISGKLQPIRGPLRTALKDVDLPFQTLTKEQLRPYLTLPNFQARTAAQIVRLLDEGQQPERTFRAPFAVWQFDNDLTLVALPSEPVSEFVYLLRDALGPDKLWVSGYNNDFFGYLPTAKVIKEGGHEAIGVTTWSQQEDLARRVGFFAPQVQDLVISTVKELAAEVGRK